jgi:hypothetical protein
MDEKEVSTGKQEREASDETAMTVGHSLTKRI